MKTLTASDHRRLIRLASTMEKGSEARRAILAGLSLTRRASSPKTAEDWIEKAVERPGRLHRYFNIPEGEKIPVSKIDGEIKKLESKDDRTAEETSLLRALNLAKTLRKMGGEKKEEKRNKRRSSTKKKAESLADLPDAPMGYKWEDVSDEWGDTAFTLYRRGDEVGSVVDNGRNWVTYVAGEDWPIGRGQSDIWDAGFQLLDHLGLS